MQRRWQEGPRGHPGLRSCHDANRSAEGVEVQWAKCDRVGSTASLVMPFNLLCDENKIAASHARDNHVLENTVHGKDYEKDYQQREAHGAQYGPKTQSRSSWKHSAVRPKPEGRCRLKALQPP